MFFIAMLNLQLQLFFIMALGYVCQKCNIINSTARKSMSDLLIYVILPCNIIQGFTSQVNVSKELLLNCAAAFIISLVIQFAAANFSKLLFRNWEREKRLVASYGMIVSNSSFIGIPVTESIYGSLGVLYTAIFQIPIRFNMWTSGIKLFTTVDKKSAIKKVLTHPCIIACFAGFAMMLLKLSFPGFLGSSIASLSKCTGPLSMLIIGAILSDVNVAHFFSKEVLFFSFIRLIAFPLTVWFILKLLNINSMIIGISVILTAMPAGSTTAILPQKYNCDAEYGAVLIFASTLLSIITIPLFGLLLK